MSRIAYLRNGSADAIATGRATTLVMFRYPISNRLYHRRNLGHVAVRPYRIDCFPRQILLRRSLLRFLLHLYPILKIDTPTDGPRGCSSSLSSRCDLMTPLSIASSRSFCAMPELTPSRRSTVSAARRKLNQASNGRGIGIISTTFSHRPPSAVKP